MRAFIAFPIKNSFNYLKQKYSFEQHLNWIKKHHITLHFIKQIDESVFLEMSEKIKGILQGYSTPFINSEPLLELIPQKSPKMLWIRFTNEDKRIYKLHTEIKNAFKDFSKCTFRPHITLTRIKRKPSQKFCKSVLSERIKQKSFLLNELIFYKSILKKEGAIHIPLDSFRIKK